MKKNIFCNQCQHQFSDPSVLEVETACPNCNSIEKLVAVNTSDSLAVQIDETKTFLRGKDPLKRIGKSNKYLFEKLRLKRRDAGDRLILLQRLQDRDNDLYKEKVENLETGEVIRDVTERLSEHRGHGSAKFKKKMDP